MKNNYTAKMSGVLALTTLLGILLLSPSKNSKDKTNKEINQKTIKYEDTILETKNENLIDNITYDYDYQKNNEIKEEKETINFEDYKTNNKIYLAYLNMNSNIYKEDNSNNIINTIDAYQKVLAYDINDYSFILDENNNTGYILKNNLTKLPDKFVEIDLESQLFRIINNKETTLETNCTTGKDSTQTNIGYFDIDGKYLNACLRGSDYECPVSYWVPFDGGIGFHDYIYQSDEMFGSQNYHTDGSHGCVRLNLNDAQKAYNEIETGDMVLVHK